MENQTTKPFSDIVACHKCKKDFQFKLDHPAQSAVLALIWWLDHGGLCPECTAAQATGETNATAHVRDRSEAEGT